MRVYSSKSDLSNGRRRLVELMQELGFGRIEGLAICASEPVLDPPPTIIREVKFTAQNGPRDERRLNDFVLKVPVVEMFHEFDRLRDGVIAVLTIKHGLPFRMDVSHKAGAR